MYCPFILGFFLKKFGWLIISIVNKNDLNEANYLTETHELLQTCNVNLYIKTSDVITLIP